MKRGWCEISLEATTSLSDRCKIWRRRCTSNLDSPSFSLSTWWVWSLFLNRKTIFFRFPFFCSLFSPSLVKGIPFFLKGLKLIRINVFEWKIRLMEQRNIIFRTRKIRSWSRTYGWDSYGWIINCNGMKRIMVVLEYSGYRPIKYGSRISYCSTSKLDYKYVQKSIRKPLSGLTFTMKIAKPIHVYYQ